MKKIFLSLVAIATISSAEIIRSNGAEIVLDTDTNLIWQDNSDAKTVMKNWNDAIKYCENLNFAGFDDWKLPNKETLFGIVDKSKYPTIKAGLQNITADRYWSSSPVGSVSNIAWLVSFSNGYDGYMGDGSRSNLVRCVRDSKNFEILSFSSLVNSLKANTIIDKGITLVSTPQASKSKLFLVKKDGRNYFGTQSELLKEFGFTAGYSQNPFQDIQNLTQQQLNEYLALPNIEIPKITKDEFETKKEFEYRLQIAQEDYRKKVEARNQELENRRTNIENKKQELLFKNFVSTMGDPKLVNPTFDAETKTMYADVSMSNANWTKKVAIKIEDRNIAKDFKAKIDNGNVSVEFTYENDSFVVTSINVINSGIIETAKVMIEKEIPQKITKTKVVKGFFGNSEEKYEETIMVKTPTEITTLQPKVFIALLDSSDYKSEKLTIALQEVPHLQNPNLIVPTISYSESSQAKGIKYDDDLTPMVNNLKPSSINNNKWLFAIAIEKYDEADSVTFAKNSAEAFIKTAQKRFGISDRNTYALIDDKATSASIKDRLTLMLGNVKEGDSVYFYYSGHGIPNPSDGEAYILPKDKIVDFVTKEKEFMVRNLYRQLSDSKASKVIAFVDSCFSGNTDGISNIKGVAATRMKTKQVEFDKSKMVVITAGTSNQFSNAFSQKGHRLFTYYLTKSIAQRPVLDIDSIYKEVSLNVKDESYKMGDLKHQTPQIEGNVGLGL